MKVVVAIDSFKGSLSSLQAGNAVKDAVVKVDGSAEVVVRCLADGGEGTVQAFAECLNSQIVTLTVNGPLCSPVEAQYCILKDTNTAVIEMASAAGLTLIPEGKRDPLETTTYGVGELIKDAVFRGCRRFIIGLGGSATNDGGAGMLTALDFELSVQNHNPIPLGAKGLEKLHAIHTDKVMPELKECCFLIACDVTNPLCGANGCSAVFGPQKGATPEMIAHMDAWLENYARISKTVSCKADENLTGAGAAGGLGFAFSAFTNTQLKSGIQIILDEIKLEEDIKTADIVVTGEGRLDSQTVLGKAPIGVAKLGKKYGKKVIAFSGCAAKDAQLCNAHGIDAYFPILRRVTTLEEALDVENAYENLADTAYQVFRLLTLQ